MARYALVSDLQFDEQMRYSRLLPEGVMSRLVDSVECFDWVVKESVDRSCQGLWVLGDVFDSRTSVDLSVLDYVCRAVARASELLKIDMLVGNHDCKLRAPNVNSLQVFRGLATIHERPGSKGPFAFCPWIEDVDDLGNAIKMLAKKPAEVRFLLGHVMVQGAVPNAYGLDPQVLMPERWDEIILGDVHEPTEVVVTGSGANITYCGSPMQWHFGDQGRPRGFFVLDDETGEMEFVENEVSPRFHYVHGVEDLEAVREGDFVRVMHPDATIAQAIAQEIPNVFVESLAVHLGDEKPRLNVSTADPFAELLRKWLKHQKVGTDAVDDLLSLGLELLEESK